MMNQNAFTMATLIVFGVFGSAHAAPLSGTGFSDFNTGVSVDGQGGWSSDNPAWDEEVVLDATNSNYVWRVSNAVTAGSFGDMPFAPRPGGIPDDTVNDPVNSDPLFFAGESSTMASFRQFLGEFSFRSVTGTAQTGLRITVSIDNGQGARQSFVAVTDTGFGIDVTTFDLDEDGNFLGPITIAQDLSYTDWHTIGMEAFFKDGTDNDRVKYFVDGKLVHQGPSWEQFYTNFQATLHPLGVPVQTLLFRLSGPAVPGVTGDGYYIDNVFTSNSKKQ
ncbi:hypothetical protein [Methyloglobulus sp.]|uniref:hypothetical protein n=1 Tax=Methyloglobulus sp. TaxID=2518622 RepID=UPI00398A47A2